MADELVHDIHHASVIVQDTGRALGFYSGVLGLEQDLTRPDIGYPGAWLKIGKAQIHLLELPNPDPVENRPSHGGHDRHIALAVTDLKQMVDRLERADIDYTLSKSGRHALFCRDPDSNAVEMIEMALT